jgi:hypothetical protein
MILIIANPDDAHVRYVLLRLAEKGAAVACFDVKEFPASSTVSVGMSASASQVHLRRASGDLDLARVRTVWLRRLTDVRADPDLSAEDREFVTRESSSLLFGLGMALGDRFWVNPLVAACATDRGKGKLAELHAACQVGLAIPRTMATNDPEAAREFLRSCPSGAIYKPFLSPTRDVTEPGGPTRYGTVYTNKLDEEALEALDDVRLGPCIFQELVPKRVELRVVVMGTKVFATEIHSQAHEASSIDFRRHYALDETPYSAHELPATVAQQCIAVNERLGLCFGAFDFVLTPEGRYVFLEVNQQGQFLWLEHMTGQPLLENFCELLIQGRPDFVCPAEAHAPGLPELPPLED